MKNIPRSETYFYYWYVNWYFALHPFISKKYCPFVFPGLESPTWWRHQMETFSALLAPCAGNPPVTGGFPSQRPVMRSFRINFDQHLNKRLTKQSRRRWFETSMRSLWRHCNAISSPLYRWYPHLVSNVPSDILAFYGVSPFVIITPHERHLGPNHWPSDCLFNSLGGPTSKKHPSLQYCPWIPRTMGQ